MQRNQIEEFYRELDATDETYVRRKHAMNGYAGWRAKHARTWIDTRDQAKQDRQASSMKFWAMVSALGTIVAAAAAVIAFIPRQ